MLLVLFIDEVGQVCGALVEAMDLVLQKVRDNNHPFGGVSVVATSDHYQNGADRDDASLSLHALPGVVVAPIAVPGVPRPPGFFLGCARPQVLLGSACQHLQGGPKIGAPWPKT